MTCTTIPEKPYTKDELQAYLENDRQKRRATFEALTDEKANQRCKFPWGEEASFAELQLYSMRDVQEHAAQLSLHLGQKTGSAPDWVPTARSRATRPGMQPTRIARSCNRQGVRTS